MFIHTYTECYTRLTPATETTPDKRKIEATTKDSHIAFRHCRTFLPLLASGSSDASFSYGMLQQQQLEVRNIQQYFTQVISVAVVKNMITVIAMEALGEVTTSCESVRVCWRV